MELFGSARLAESQINMDKQNWKFLSNPMYAWMCNVHWNVQCAPYSLMQPFTIIVDCFVCAYYLEWLVTGLIPQVFVENMKKYYFIIKKKNTLILILLKHLLIHVRTLSHTKTLQYVANNRMFVHDTNNTHIIDYHTCVCIGIYDSFWQLLLSQSFSISFSRFHISPAFRLTTKHIILPILSFGWLCVWCWCWWAYSHSHVYEHCTMYMLKDRCTSFKDSECVIHNKWRHFNQIIRFCFVRIFLLLLLLCCVVLATNHLLLVDCSFFG